MNKEVIEYQSKSSLIIVLPTGLDWWIFLSMKEIDIPGKLEVSCRFINVFAPM